MTFSKRKTYSMARSNVMGSLNKTGDNAWNHLGDRSKKAIKSIFAGKSIENEEKEIRRLLKEYSIEREGVKNKLALSTSRGLTDRRN